MSARERKVVTVLFADLVGFTSRSEQLDPEDLDVRADALGRYLSAASPHGSMVGQFPTWATAAQGGGHRRQ